MPLIFQKEIDSSTTVAVWKIEEDNNFFISRLDLDLQEKAALDLMRDHRKREWLSSRYLLHILCPSEQRFLISKDLDGKPTLSNNGIHISISHSQKKVAVIRSSNPVGVDIQREEIKIGRIQHKFIADHEHQTIDQEHVLESYHLFWGAKECMYKAYGKRALEFRDHMHLYPFKYYQEQLELEGWVRKENCSQDYKIFCEKLEDYYLTVAVLYNEY